MTPDQIVWTMITNLLCNIYTYYSQNNVFYAFQNNFKVPQTDNFVILTKLNQNQIAYPTRYFDQTAQNEVYIGHGDWEYQVDLYGQNSDLASDILHTYLNSGAGSNYLYLYPINMGIGKVMPPLNLTKSNDRDQWMKRFTLKFTLLNNTSTLIPTAGIGISDVTITVQQET